MVQLVKRGDLSALARTTRKLNCGVGATSPEGLGFGGSRGRRSWVNGLLLGGLAVAAISGRRQAAMAKEEINKVLEDPQWPEEFPFGEGAMRRLDESDDSFFYSAPRLVTHIDDDARKALTNFYSEAFPKPSESTALLDICSSWVSHYPKNYKAPRIVGHGMNEEELKQNSMLSEYVVKDLNRDASLPFGDNEFDVVTNAVSIDYLTQPLAVTKEVGRVLKPGGLAIYSFSNRCFPTKAVGIWTQTGDKDHVWYVGSLFHFAGNFEEPAARDISPKPGFSDPMYIVYARKKQQ